MKAWKKELLKEWWNNNLDYLPLGARWRGLWQKGHVTGIIKELDERKLDIAIAQRIFDYKINVGERTVYHDDGSQTEVAELQYLAEVYTDGSGEHWEAIPNYSTDINSAFLIVEKLRNVTTVIAMGPCSEKGYWCEIFGEGLVATIPVRDTLPGAICCAALNATKQWI